MPFMCFRPLVFPFQPKNETVSQSVTAWKAGKALDLSAPRLEAIAWAAVYLIFFSSPKCNPQFFHLYFFNDRDCKYNNVSVSNSYYYPILQHEEILVCRPLRGCIHSYGSGLFLWMKRPRCHRKWRRVFREKLEFSRFFSERKQNRSLLFSSFFKKLFQVEGNGAKGNTLRRWPWPRLLFVPAFKLSAR